MSRFKYKLPSTFLIFKVLLPTMSAAIVHDIFTTEWGQFIEKQVKTVVLNDYIQFF